MNTISIVLSSLSLLSTPILANGVAAPKNVQVQNIVQTQIGGDSIALIRVAFDNGEYAEFLDEMDRSFRDAKDNKKLEGLIEMRGASLPEIDQKKWEELSSQLETEKNKGLLKAIGDENSPFAQKVKSAATDSLSPEERNAFLLLTKLRAMAPAAGKNSDENQLIDFDLEYEFKMLSLNIPLVKGQTAAPALREKQTALRMEKMKKMAEAAKTFQDESLKKTVLSASSKLDEYLAQSWDRADLQKLAKNKKQAANPTEEKVASILISYQGKYFDLSKDFLQNQ